MPRRATHDAIGTGVGIVAGTYRVARRRKRYPERRANAFHDGLQVIGTTLASRYASRLPDIIEPAARNPRHRGTAHSGTVAGIAASALQAIDAVEDWARDAAETQAQKRRAAWDAACHSTRWTAVGCAAKAGWHLIVEIILGLLAGVPAGVFIGYVSHVAADSCTSAGIPVI